MNRTKKNRQPTIRPWPLHFHSFYYYVSFASHFKVAHNIKYGSINLALEIFLRLQLKYLQLPCLWGLVQLEHDIYSTKDEQKHFFTMLISLNRKCFIIMIFTRLLAYLNSLIQLIKSGIKFNINIISWLTFKSISPNGSESEKDRIGGKLVIFQLDFMLVIYLFMIIFSYVFGIYIHRWKELGHSRFHYSHVMNQMENSM